MLVAVRMWILGEKKKKMNFTQRKERVQRPKLNLSENVGMRARDEGHASCSSQEIMLAARSAYEMGAAGSRFGPSEWVGR